MTRLLLAAGLAIFAVSAAATISGLASGAWLAQLDAQRKPSIQSCTGQPHVDPQR